MPTVKHAKYLLVLVDTSSGLVEAFATTNKRTQTIFYLLLWEIIPRFVVPASLQSDSGLEFTSQLSLTLSKTLDMPWRFHILYHCQSLDKVERTNCSLKTTLVKPSQKLHLNWVKLLPLTLLRLQALTKQPLFILLFELMYGHLVLTPVLSPKCSPLPWSSTYSFIFATCALSYWTSLTTVYEGHKMSPIHCLSILETRFFYPLQTIISHLNGRVLSG